jgi:hypothetical protein
LLRKGPAFPPKAGPLYFRRGWPTAQSIFRSLQAPAPPCPRRLFPDISFARMP